MNQKKSETNGTEGNYPPLLIKLLAARGIEDPEAIERFLHPSLEKLHDPFLLNGMDAAVDRIVRALEDREAICIYGDYDVDGITSVAVLYDFLEGLGADVSFYIPDRQKDGYGLTVDALEKLISKKVELIITVDCGTTSVKEAEFLKREKIDLIVTDHHECKDAMPYACAILNPTIPGSPYPFRSLSGIGVVYKLVTAMCTRLGKNGREQGYLDLAAVGTVADAVSMTDENRIIVSFGLKKINSRPNLGLLRLIISSGMENRVIDEDSVGYAIAPRMNAAGRLGDPADAVNLLLTDDSDEAQKIAEMLCDLNRERQMIQSEILNDVENIIAADPDRIRDNVFVVSGEGWKSGIIGIVASIIAEKYKKPTLVITFENDGRGKGSGRSIEGFNLFEALAYSSDLLSAFGGHEKAAGFTVEKDNIDAFRAKINEYALMVGIVKKKQDDIGDLVLNNEYLDIDTIMGIKMMAPFGEGNPKPVFAYTDLKISEIKLCGNGDKHLKLRLDRMGDHIDCIAFNQGETYRDLAFGDRIDVSGYMQVNEWNNRKYVQMQVTDIKRGAI